jgi:protein-disulfide isomerase
VVWICYDSTSIVFSFQYTADPVLGFGPKKTKGHTMNRTKIYALVGLFALGVSLFLAGRHFYLKNTAKNSLSADLVATLIRDHSPSLGDVNAPVTMVEFLDPECESCAAIYPYIKAIMNEYQGKVRLVVRYAPFHGNSVFAAQMLEAARQQGRYWELIEVMFDRLPEWGSHHAPKPELLPVIAKSIGLDTEKMMQAIEAGTFNAQIELDRADAQKLEVKQTPTFFINGQKPAELTLEAIRSLIDQALKN